MRSKPAIITLLAIAPFLYTPNTIGQYSSEMRQDPAFQDTLASMQDGWSTIESKYFTIYLEAGVDAKRVQRRLNDRMFYTYPAHRPDKSAGNEEKIAYRMDTLLERVKDILGIYPASMRVQIKIFKTRRELNDEFARIVARRQEIKSFYVHKYETIYASEADINDSIIAHEMGHAVVDHYFMVIPPEKFAEMLASYVDLHLDD